MTVLQVINSLFYILIYPYLIRVLGAEAYGLYIYALSVVTYFIYLINFGFDLPAVKAVAQNALDRNKLEKIFASIFTAKLYLLCLSLIIFLILLFTVPFFMRNAVLFILVYVQVVSHLLIPLWYYQGVQKMKRLTVIQLVFKLLSLPLIFYWVRSVKDLNIFAFINALTLVLGGFFSFFAVVLFDGIKFKLAKSFEVWGWYKDAFPFFLSNSVGVIKEQSIILLIGVFFGMRDVAIYDLANKIVIIPRTLLMSINGALFPKIITSASRETVRKIIRWEFIIGVAVVGFIGISGRWIVNLLGGAEMSGAYPVAFILSMTVISWLVVGAYVSFVFIPNHKSYWVMQNQIVALLSLVLFIIIGYALSVKIYILALGLAFSGIMEIFFCYFKTSKAKLL